jgi:hypothetical protein
MLKRLWLGFALAFLLGIAVEYNRGNPPRGDVPVQVEDESGRRQLLLIIDSLSIPNFKSMPALQAIAKDGYYAEVEPCLERITYVCVKEALTGRTTFTLFGLFQNFGVGTTDPGDSILRDAKAAGKTVAMVSAGDLGPFKGDLHSDDRFKKGPSKREEAKAESRAQEADLLVYHWIWHDTQAHHYKVGSKKYKKSVREANKFVKRVVEWLPEDMDLIIAGDHGHAEDGRHVQGLDIPTVVIAKSPNIKPVHLKERIPISALRFLSGASIGLYSDQIDWDPKWADWLTDRVGPTALELIASGSARAPPGFPFAALVVCLIIIILTSAVGRRWWAPVLGLVAFVMGAYFEEAMGLIHFPGSLPRVHTVLWYVPTAAWVLGLLATRRLQGAFTATTATVGVLLLVLYPVVHHYGALKNLGNLAAPLVLATAAAAIVKPNWFRRFAILLLGVLAAWTFYKLSDFRIFNIEIVKYRGVMWMKGQPLLTSAVIGLLAGSIHMVLDPGKWPKRIGGAALAAVGASGVSHMSDMAYIVPTVLIFVAFFLRRASYARVFSLGFAWASPHMYTDMRLFGVYAVVAAVAIGLWIAKVADQGRTTRWASGIIAAIGCYLGLAWTFGLTTGGIDFTFAIAWLPGRLHEQLWWVIAIVMTFKCLAHIAFIAFIIKRLHGNKAEDYAHAAAGIGLLRYSFIAVFAIAWLIAADEQAGGLRLAGMLQDGFYWLVLSLMLVGMVRLGPKMTQSEKEEKE